MTLSRAALSTLRIMDSGVLTAQENMDLDFSLLQSLEIDPQTTLRFYRFPPVSCTHGLFMEPMRFFNADSVKSRHVQVAKRPTGGGLIFHTYDFTFSFLMPANHPLFPQNVKESYRLINSLALSAVREVFGVKPVLAADAEEKSSPQGGFCLAKATVYDLMLNGKKIGGAAQRRTKPGLLHQASITLGLPDEDLLLALLSDHPAIAHAMLENSCPLLQKSPPPPSTLLSARSALQEALTQAFTSKNLYSF